jgi:hypothetical protein
MKSSVRIAVTEEGSRDAASPVGRDSRTGGESYSDSQKEDEEVLRVQCEELEAAGFRVLAEKIRESHLRIRRL